MSTVEDVFAKVVSDCLASLVLGTETAVDPALVTMTRINWGAVEVVGDQSDWVGTVTKAMVGTAAVVGKRLNEVWCCCCETKDNNVGTLCTPAARVAYPKKYQKKW